MNSTSFDRGSGSRKWWILGGGCLALFVCLCAAGIIAVTTVSDSTVAQFKRLVGLSSESASIEYVPLNAPVFAVVNPNFSQLAGFAKLQAIFDKDPAFRQQIDELTKRSAGQDSDLNFDRDVKPWIGTEIGVALFDVPASGSRDSANGVIIAATRDHARSDEALARIRKSAEDKGATFSEETYQNVKIATGKPNEARSSPTSYATFQDQVLIGNADAIKKAIDTKQAGEKASLKSSAAYKRILDQLPKDRAASVFVDLSALVKQSTTATQPGVEALEAFQGLGLSLAFADDGIRVDYTSAFDKNKAPESLKKLWTSYKANNGAVLDLLPSSSIVSLAGQDLKSNWEYYRDVFGNNPQMQFQRSLDELKQQTGIDVDADVFSWMTGEFAIDVVPAKPLAALGTTAPAVGLLLMIEAKDQNLVKGKIEKIAKVFTSQGLAFTAKKINGVDMQVVAGAAAQGLSLGYGFVDNYLVIGSAEDVLSAAVDGKKASLSKDAEYQKAAKPLPQPKISVGYFSIPKLVDLIKPTLSRAQQADFQKTAEPLLKPFKSFSVAAGVPNDDVQSGLFFIHVAE